MKNFSHRAVSRTAIKIICTGSLLLTLALLSSGCGGDSESNAADSSGKTGPVSPISRPDAYTIEVVDAYGDIIDREGKTQKAAPTWLDINRASITKVGDEFKLTLDLAATLPDRKPADPSFLGAEWGFLFDFDDDTSPDFGVYAGLPKLNWTYGLFNHNTSERHADSIFPGTFKREGSTIILTVKQSALGSPAKFKWLAYSDASHTLTGNEQDDYQRAGDSVPEETWPRGGTWLSYP